MEISDLINISLGLFISLYDGYTLLFQSFFFLNAEFLSKQLFKHSHESIQLTT